MDASGRSGDEKAACATFLTFEAARAQREISPKVLALQAAKTCADHGGSAEICAGSLISHQLSLTDMCIFPAVVNGAVAAALTKGIGGNKEGIAQSVALRSAEAAQGMGAQPALVGLAACLSHGGR